MRLPILFYEIGFYIEKNKTKRRNKTLLEKLGKVQYTGIKSEDLAKDKLLRYTIKLINEGYICKFMTNGSESSENNENNARYYITFKGIKELNKYNSSIFKNKTKIK